MQHLLLEQRQLKSIDWAIKNSIEVAKNDQSKANDLLSVRDTYQRHIFDQESIVNQYMNYRQTKQKRLREMRADLLEKGGEKIIQWIQNQVSR